LIAQATTAGNGPKTLQSLRAGLEAARAALGAAQEAISTVQATSEPVQAAYDDAGGEAARDKAYFHCDLPSFVTVCVRANGRANPRFARPTPSRMSWNRPIFWGGRTRLPPHTLIRPGPGEPARWSRSVTTTTKKGT